MATASMTRVHRAICVARQQYAVGVDGTVPAVPALLAALRRYEILDTASEAVCDCFTTLAAGSVQCPDLDHRLR
jgi:hypothetical protein